MSKTDNQTVDDLLAKAGNFESELILDNGFSDGVMRQVPRPFATRKWVLRIASLLSVVVSVVVCLRFSEPFVNLSQTAPTTIALVMAGLAFSVITFSAVLRD